ncbi:MAG: MFS transporter [Chloroflexota bacterium]
MERVKSTLRRLHPNVWVLATTSFLTDISSEMLFNLLPLFLFNVLGVRTSIIGLIEGLAETTSSLVKIYSGAISDRIRKRKLLAVLGYGLSTLAKPFLYFATSWTWVLGVRFIDRVGKGVRTAPRDALLAGSTDVKHRGFTFGLHRAADTGGALVGLGIAAAIIWSTQAGATSLSRSTFQYIVLASVIPAALAVLILTKFAVDVRPSKDTLEGVTPGFHWTSLNRRFRAFLLVVILFTLGNSADAFIVLRGQERGLNVLQITGMLLTFNALYSLLSTPLGLLSDRIGRVRVILGGWFVYGLIYLGFAMAQSGYVIWLLYGFYGVYYAATEGTAKALVADLVTPDKRGTAYGLYHAAVGLAAFPASLIAGLLWQGAGAWQGFGPAAPFIFGALMALLAAILFIAWARD